MHLKFDGNITITCRKGFLFWYRPRKWFTLHVEDVIPAMTVWICSLAKWRSFVGWEADQIGTSKDEFKPEMLDIITRVFVIRPHVFYHQFCVSFLQYDFFLILRSIYRRYFGNSLYYPLVIIECIFYIITWLRVTISYNHFIA
jgi:hypothetical protein